VTVLARELAVTRIYPLVPVQKPHDVAGIRHQNFVQVRRDNHPNGISKVAQEPEQETDPRQVEEREQPTQVPLVHRHQIIHIHKVTGSRAPSSSHAVLHPPKDTTPTIHRVLVILLMANGVVLHLREEEIGNRLKEHLVILPIVLGALLDGDKIRACPEESQESHTENPRESPDARNYHQRPQPPHAPTRESEDARGKESQPPGSPPARPSPSTHLAKRASSKMGFNYLNYCGLPLCSAVILKGTPLEKSTTTTFT
jgi:hypothetical protein